MSWKPFSWVGGSFLVALLLIGGWAWYIYAQRLSLDENNWHELAHVAGALSTTFSSLPSTADQYFREFKAAALNKPENKEHSTEKKLHEKAQQFEQRNPYIRDRSPAEFQRRNPLIGDGKGIQPTRANPSSEHARLVDPRRLDVPCWFVAAKRGGPGTKVLGFEVSPEAIFADAVISEAFDYLFIADQNGRVLFEMEHGTVGQRKEEKGWLERRAQGDSSQAQSAVSIMQLKKLAEVGGKEIDPSMLAAASGSRSIRLGDKTYQLYSCPLAITEFQRERMEGSIETTWIVGGLVDPRHMWREALTISPQWTLLLFLLFAIAVAAQPFVKLFLLSRTERFRFLDACLLSPSAAFLLLSTSVLLLSAGTRWHQRSLSSDQLAALAQRVEDNLTSELREMRNQLVEYDNHLGRLAQLPQKNAINLFGDNTPRWPTEPPSYQDFHQISWIDSRGQQFLKGSVYDYNIPNVNASSRPYFTEARDAHFWSFAKQDGRPFFVQSARSTSTAELFTALSVRSVLEKDCHGTPEDDTTGKNKKRVIAVIAAKPVSMERPLLPLGYGFAVIRADGLVLFHSDRRRSLRENLHDELADPERLYAAIQARTPQHFNTTYARCPTEVFIQPFQSIPEAGWFVVTFRDERWLETLTSEALLKAMSWSMVSMGALFLLFFGLVAAGRKCLRHLWPDPQKAAFYKVIAIVGGVVLLVGLSGVALLSGGSLLAGSVGFAFLVVLLIVIAHLVWTRRAAHPCTSDETASYHTWYLVALATLWASVTVVPAAGVCRYAWEREQAKLNWAEQDHVDSHRRHWLAQEQDRANQLSITNRDAYLRKRARYLNTYYVASVESRPGDESQDGSSADTRSSLGLAPWWDQLLDRYLPLYNEPVRRLRYGLLAPAKTSRSYWAVGLAFTWPVFLGAPVVFVLAWAWLRYKARHLLWSELAGSQSLKTPVEIAEEHRFVVLLTPSEREKFMVARMLERGTAASAGAGAYQATLVAGAGSSGQRKLVMVDDFERLMLEQDKRQEKLQELERTEASGGRTVIICHKDPLYLFSGQEGTDDDFMKVPVDMSVLERDRWLRVLNPFVLHITAVNGAGACGKPSAESDTSETVSYSQQAYFGSLWRYCSRPEKLTLVHVAQEGFANPHQCTAVEHLVKKGLLVFRPNLTLMSPEFETYVLQRASSSEVKDWEQAQGAFGWQQMRWIFALMLIGALMFLAGTQETWIKGVTAMLAGVATALEIVSKMLGSVQRSRQVLA